ncbi:MULTISPECIES: hypothetical protein [Pseudomonas]|uniref:Bacteriophage lambda head decoration protein D n=1 Tax=Pseudomonas azadiae TaxID=2843612 RepID=A0ABS6P403_9PSED|nr:MULTISPECIES: hypothetical protein [Pseudomonas]MBV4454984.1 hypothetical protein [Pseudomonas azadiae]NMF38761.1 hypothetical protein [Pseudomonas sp. SWRI 103]
MKTTLLKAMTSPLALSRAIIKEAVGDKIRLNDVINGGTLHVPAYPGAATGDTGDVYLYSGSGAYTGTWVITTPVFPLVFSVPKDAFALGSLRLVYVVTNPAGDVAVAPETLYEVIA